MSEYIRSNKFDPNECTNIFVKEKLIRTNVRIYIRDQYIRIFEYSNIFVTLCFQQSQQKEIWFAAQTNPIKHFPKFDGSQLWCRNGDSHWNEIWKAVETNPIQLFPKFDGHCESPSSFEEVSWHFVKKKTPRSPSKSEFRCMGGLINRFLPVWCPISNSIWPLLFPHQLSRGCGTRLSIRRQDPNTYSDTEMRALSSINDK